MSRFSTSVIILALVTIPTLVSAANTGVDSAFGPDSGHYRFDRDTSNESVHDAAIDSQGRVYLAFLLQDGNDSNIYWPAVMRLGADGYGDPSFGFLGLWYESSVDAAADCTVAIAVDASDRPIIGWTYEFDQAGIPNKDWFIRRLTTSGQLDSAQVVAFDIGLNGSGDRLDELTDLKVMPDGRIVAVGGAQYDNTDWDMAVGIIKDNGAGSLVMDTSFDTNGRRTVNFDLSGSSKYDNADAVIVDNTGNIVLVGWCHSSSGNMIGISRLDKDSGAYDTSFNSTGKATYVHKPLISDPELPARGVAVTLKSTGFIVGAVVTNSPFQKIGLLGLLSDGSVDYGFGTNGWFTADPGYPGTLWTDTTRWLGGLATDYDRIVFSGSIDDPYDPSQSQGIVGVLNLNGTPFTDFTTSGYDFYRFEPDGEQMATGFSTVLVPGNFINTASGKAILAGSMRGVTGGGSRTDQDLLATRVLTSPVGDMLFSDDFESGGFGAWSSVVQ